MNYNKFQVLEFKLERMVKDPAIVMIAKRGSGKSWVTRDILYHYRHMPGGTVIAPTDRMNPFYKFFFPDIYIHYEIKESTLKKILLRQMLMLEKVKEKKKKGLKVDASGILVMDDCLSRKKSWASDQSIIEILMNGRHYKLTYILTMQTPLGITPDLRLNFDYIFLLKEDTQVNKKKLYDNYAGMFRNIFEFEKVFATCTANHCCMVIDNRMPADNIQDKVFWFKAKERKFSFGSKKFINFHKKYYDQNFMIKSKARLMGNNIISGRRNKNDIDIKVEKI